MEIRQSYHGTGGKDGYLFEVFSDQGLKLGTLDDLPHGVSVGKTVEINHTLYIVDDYHEPQTEEAEKYEVIIYRLKLFSYEPDFNLGLIKKNTLNSNTKKSH